MARTLKPLADRVLVRRVETRDKIGLIVVPDAAKEIPQEGVVLAIGTGRMLESGVVMPVTVAVGDKVLFGKFSGQESPLDEHEVLLRDEEIMGIVEGEPDPEPVVTPEAEAALALVGGPDAEPAGAPVKSFEQWRAELGIDPGATLGFPAVESVIGQLPMVDVPVPGPEPEPAIPQPDGDAGDAA